VPLAREYLPRFPAHAAVVRAVVPDVPVPGRFVSVTGGPPAPPPPPPAPVPAPVAAVPAAVPLAQPVPAAVPLAVVLTRQYDEFALDPEPGPVRPRRRRRGRLVLVAVGLLAVVGVVLALTLPPGRTDDPDPPPDPNAPAVAGGKGKRPKFDPKKASVDPERDLAQWVLDVGGRGTLVLEAGPRRPFAPEVPLPKGKFVVTGLSLPPEAAGQWAADDLERLRGRDKVASVVLHHPTALTDEALEPLAGLPLRVLELHGSPVRVTAATLARFPELETLTLFAAPEFSDADAAAVGKLPRLTTFAVDSPKLTAAGLKELKNPLLRSLTFGPAVVPTAQHVRTLQTLPLEHYESHAGMTDDAFLEFAVFQPIRRIRLRQTTLTDPALKAVAGLGRLEEFQVIGSNVTGPGLEFVAERTGLKVLDLSGGKVTDAGVEKLLPLPALRELRLAGCPVTDQGVRFLAELEGLQVLDLARTAVTDQGLGILKMHPTLKSLVLTGTPVTPAAVQEFVVATPNCKVEFRAAT
jgi:hypothetical protein